jgi:hypothetical protein
MKLFRNGFLNLKSLHNLLTKIFCYPKKAPDWLQKFSPATSCSYSHFPAFINRSLLHGPWRDNGLDENSKSCA